MTIQNNVTESMQTGYLVPAKKPAKTTATAKPKKNMVQEAMNELYSKSPMMYHFTKDRMSCGDPLITVAYDRGSGRGCQSTGKEVPIEVLQEKLKNKKLDKDMRATIELEIKRQQQYGVLTEEQTAQWEKICERKREESLKKFDFKM